MNKCRNVAKSLFFILLSMCSTTFAFEPIRSDVLIAKGHDECIQRGPKGYRGKKGEEGDRGPHGHRGKKGEEGDRGHQGKKGKEGHPGHRGHRGDRGNRGQRGHRGSATGPQGSTGPAGTSGITNYFSGVTSAFNAGNGGVIPIGNNILSFSIVNSTAYSYNTGTGVITSTAGPGTYEITYGAVWTGNGTLVLIVDGSEINPLGRLNGAADWQTESVIVQSSATNPTFAIGNSFSAAAAMTLGLASNGTMATAFVTIKKIN